MNPLALLSICPRSTTSAGAEPFYSDNPRNFKPIMSSEVLLNWMHLVNLAHFKSPPKSEGAPLNGSCKGGGCMGVDFKLLQEMCLYLQVELSTLFLVLRPALRSGESETQSKKGSEKEDINFVDFQCVTKPRTPA